MQKVESSIASLTRAGFVKLDREVENYSEETKNHSEGDRIPFDVVGRMKKNNHKECRYSFDVVLERHSDNFF
jgi:hypothetical protein